jgi:hypothetical protein
MPSPAINKYSHPLAPPPIRLLHSIITQVQIHMIILFVELIATVVFAAVDSMIVSVLGGPA